MRPPDTRYTKSGDVHIAYQVVGDGPLDLGRMDDVRAVMDTTRTHELKGVPRDCRPYTVAKS